MIQMTQHEVLELQEHIRVEAASAQMYSHYATMATDREIKDFCQEESRLSKQKAVNLMAMLRRGDMHA